MEADLTTPKIVSADRLDGGVIVTFENGICAVYPDTFLYNSLDNAQKVLREAEPE